MVRSEGSYTDLEIFLTADGQVQFRLVAGNSVRNPEQPKKIRLVRVAGRQLFQNAAPETALARFDGLEWFASKISPCAPGSR